MSDINDTKVSPWTTLIQDLRTSNQIVLFINDMLSNEPNLVVTATQLKDLRIYQLIKPYPNRKCRFHIHITAPSQHPPTWDTTFRLYQRCSFLRTHTHCTSTTIKWSIISQSEFFKTTKVSPIISQSEFFY